MITVSPEFQEALENGDRDYLVKVDITLPDSTLLPTITKEGLTELSIEDAVSQDSKFTALGGTVINKATVTIDNSSENYSAYDFKGAIVTIKIGLQINDSSEYVDRGVYIVDSAIPQGVGLELSCLDYMSKFDKSYTESNLTYPATIQEVIQDACTTCGVAFTGTYPDSDYVFTITPVVSTFREMLSAIGQITGTYAHVDRQGQLYFSWFNITLLNQAIGSDTKITGVHYIEDVINNTYEKDNIIIGGIRAYIINEESNEKFEYHYPSTLTDDSFCLNLTGNPLIYGGNITEIINRVGPRIVGLTIRQTNCKHVNNPLIEAGDVAMVLYSVKNNTNAYYPIVITRTTFAINQSQETVCGIETLSENLDGRYSDTQLLREQTKKDTNDARKVATNYLSVDTTGIMIADLADGTQTPSTATGRNVKIDNSFVYIRNGQTTIAQFGDVVTIGKTDGSESYQRLDYHSLQLIDKEGHAYFYVSDLRNAQGYTTFTEEHEYTSSATYISVDYIIYSIEQIIVNDSVELDYDYDYFYRQGYTFISWRQNTPGSTPHHYLNNGDKITVTYTTMDDQIKAYTLGVRKTNSSIGPMSFAEGYDTTASGPISHAEGSNTTASGRSSHAEGFNTTAKGERSHSEGYGTTASGSMSHAEGSNTTASGSLGSHAEGYFTKASGAMSHAEGVNTTASGDWSHAQGNNTTASGRSSHAEGLNTTASGDWSHVSGLATEAYGLYQTVIGRYNVIGTIGTQDYIFIMGNGNGDDARSNAFTVDWHGNVNIPSGASYKVGGVSLDDRYVNVDGDTMTGTLTISVDDGINCRVKYNSIDARIGQTAPSSNIYWDKSWVLDKNNRLMYYEEGAWRTDNSYYLSYGLCRHSADVNTRYTNGFTLYIDNNGTGNVSVTHPAEWRNAIGALYKGGDTITGNLTYKVSNVDASKTNNNLSSGTIYPALANYTDTSNRTITRFGAIIASSGTIGSEWYIRQYNTSGNQVAQKGIYMYMNKSGNLTYDISDADNFTKALGFEPANSATALTLSLKNCTGTITGSFALSVSTNKRFIQIQGRIRITSFVRTGANPGVYATLPFTPIATKSGVMIGYRGESPIELTNMNINSGSTSALIFTSESYSNAVNGTLTLIIPYAIIRIA